MVLDPAILKDAAVARTGLATFGTVPLDEGLENSSALSHEAALDERGMAGVGETIIATLSQGLKVEHALSRNSHAPNLLDK